MGSNVPKKMKGSLTSKLLIIIILVYGCLFNILVILTLKPFFYIHNGLLNNMHSHDITNDYIKADYDIELGSYFISIQGYKFVYEINGIEYCVNHYQSESEEIYDVYSLYYNKDNPQDAFVYDEKFKFDIGDVIYCSIMLLGGFTFFVYLLYSILKLLYWIIYDVVKLLKKSTNK